LAPEIIIEVYELILDGVRHPESKNCGFKEDMLGSAD
jgi:hypothetical protein